MNMSPEIKMRAFKLRVANDHPGVDQSSCFESLHELCNIQIEELKKAVRFVTDERDSLIMHLDEAKDKF